MRCFLFAIVLLLAPMQAYAQDKCIIQASGTGFATYEKDGETIAYELDAQGTIWSMQGYGYHANAALICETCSNREASWGLVHLSDTWSHRVTVPSPSILTLGDSKTEERIENIQLAELRIKSASERAQRRWESLYYPWRILRGDELEAIHLSDNAIISEFNGYAVIFSISDPSAKGMPEVVDGLIAFELTDGCAYFSGTVAVPLESPAEQLEQLLRSVRIDRIQLQKGELQ